MIGDFDMERWLLYASCSCADLICSWLNPKFVSSPHVLSFSVFARDALVRLELPTLQVAPILHFFLEFNKIHLSFQVLLLAANIICP
jgi:hypothetical protein